MLLYTCLSLVSAHFFCTAYNVMACLFYYAAIAEEAHCGYVEGVLLKETFIYTGQDNQAG